MAQSVVQKLPDLEVFGKRVFLRLDFNVPMDGQKILDDSRITEALPTIQYLIKAGAKIVIGSHLGRPDGKPKKEFSLEPIANHLAELVSADVTLADHCVGEGIELMSKNLKPGAILMLENLRFDAREEANDPEFSRELSELCDVYISDAFGTAHRKHASTYGLPAIALVKGVGFLIEKELKFLTPLVQNPERPFYAVLGGSKVTDKIKTIESLLKSVQGLCIGGAMGHAFWLATGQAIPDAAKKPKPEDIEAAKYVLEEAKKKLIAITLPVDTNEGFDIGPKTVALFFEKVKNARTLFWNGPLGWFEKEPYNQGTFEFAKLCGEISGVKIVGGGDTVSAIKQSGNAANFDHLSTGGGAVLEFIENGTLPGIEILKAPEKRGTTQSVTRERI